MSAKRRAGGRGAEGSRRDGAREGEKRTASVGEGDGVGVVKREKLFGG